MATSIWNAVTSLRDAISWSPMPNVQVRTQSTIRRIKVPDILGAFPERLSDFEVNPHCAWVTDKSNEWGRRFDLLTSSSRNGEDGVASSSQEHRGQSQTSEKSRNIPDPKAGLLASLCFPTVNATQLQICADVLNWMLLMQVRLSGLREDERKQFLMSLVSALTSETPQGASSKTGFLAALHKYVD